MENNLKKIRSKIKKGEIAIGTVVSICDTDVSEILCLCGYDFIWIDAEHSSMDKKIIDAHILTVRGYGKAPFVRVPSNDPVIVKSVLDMGPAGIIFPFINNRKNAELAIQNCKYPPDGLRGFGPRRSNLFSKIRLNKYLENSKNEPWIILQVEHIESVNNLEDILEVDGIDCIMIGPMDLAASIGFLKDPNHHKVKNLISRIAEICIKKKIIFGACIGYGERKDIEIWKERGAKILAIEWDVGHIYNRGKIVYTETKKYLS